MLNQTSAILSLLDDDEPATVSMVKRKLEEIAPLNSLKTLRLGASGRAARHLDELIATLAQRDADAEFAYFCHHFPAEGSIEKACWLLAETFPPHEPFPHQQHALDEWGDRLAALLDGIASAEEKVAVTVKFLHGEIGLRGNEADYYALDNSLLPRVLDSRRGIPISLTLIYMLVAQRAGLEIDGVSLPGHFLARHRHVFFDPFHGGRRVSMDECTALLEKQNLILTEAHLLPATPRQMLIRILTNIYYVTEQKDPATSSKVHGWLGILRAQEEGR